MLSILKIILNFLFNNHLHIYNNSGNGIDINGAQSIGNSLSNLIKLTYFSLNLMLD